MANRSFLISSNSDSPSDEYDPDKDILAAGSYLIPIFWYSSLHISNITQKVAEFDDGTRQKYPMFIARVDEAIELCQQREKQIFSVIPKSFYPSFESWIMLLRSVNSRYIHIETIELWMMDDPKAYENESQLCANAFKHEKQSFMKRVLGQPKSLNKEWIAMLKQADIDPVNIEETTDQYKLHGYKWVREVPWKEEC